MLNPPPGAQGAKAALRPAMNALTRLRWFAPLGVGLAGKFVNRALTQVTRYLTDEHIRHTAQQRVLNLIGPDTHLVICHSLGTVVAYEALHQTNQPVTLITLGSPLGLRNIIYDRLLPQPTTIPASVQCWHNYADRDDLVATQLDLNPLFPPPPGSTVTIRTGPALDNGSFPHDATHYLTKTSVGRAVAEPLANL
jgi:hypothetical protein